MFLQNGSDSDIVVTVKKFELLSNKSLAFSKNNKIFKKW